MEIEYVTFQPRCPHCSRVDVGDVLTARLAAAEGENARLVKEADTCLRMQQVAEGHVKSLEEVLAALRAKLAPVLALAEKATPGPFDVHQTKSAPSPMLTVCAGTQPVADYYRGLDKPDVRIFADADLHAALINALPRLAALLGDAGTDEKGT